MLGCLHAQHGLPDGALALLDPLSHGVEVGREVARRGEDALMILALALSIELLPPLGHEMELRLEVGHDLDLLARLLVERVAHGCILRRDIVAVGHVQPCGLLHVPGARHELADIKSCHGDREQTHRRENREASTHVVGDDERLVALLVGSRTGRTLVGVGDGDDHVLGRLLAPLGLTLLLQQAESEGRLRGRAALGDIDHAKALTLPDRWSVRRGSPRQCCCRQRG